MKQGGSFEPFDPETEVPERRARLSPLALFFLFCQTPPSWGSFPLRLFLRKGFAEKPPKDRFDLFLMVSPTGVGA